MDAFLTTNDGTNYTTYFMEQPLIEDNDKEDLAYSLWIQEKDYFTPDVSIQLHKSLPAGIYRMEYVERDWRAHQFTINTDELYSFSNSCTTTILQEAINFWNRKDVYEKYKISHKRGILLCGAPGCGKTSIIQLLVKQIVDTQNGLVFMASNKEEFAGLTQNLSSTIKKIEKDRPIITIIEDVDQLIQAFGGDSIILDFLDGSLSIENHLVILTSNNTEDLSTALLRPSRIDLIYEIPNPNAEIRKEYFINKQVEEDKLEELVKQTDGMSFAELKEVFIAVQVHGKSISDTVKRINDPFAAKDYLRKTKKIKGI